jgi:phosphatidylglycerol phospholipase C
MQHVRTVKEPHQSIPTFDETIALLMLVRRSVSSSPIRSSPQPENQHVNFNVDVKVQNTPARLFALMHKTISAYPAWEELLAPRILLGLWHPSFLAPAKEQLPYCRRSYIGNCPAIARKYFWDDCEVFSIAFAALTSADGQRSVSIVSCPRPALMGVLADSGRSARREARRSWCGPSTTRII